MHSRYIYLFIGVLAVLLQSTVYAMPGSVNAMNHGHVSEMSVPGMAHNHMMMSDSDVMEDCCQQECHCDMSLCHAGLMLPAKATVMHNLALSSLVVAATSPAMAAYSSPPYRPPISA